MKTNRLLVAAFASLAMTAWSGDTEIIIESYSDGLNSQAFSQTAGKWSESATKSTAPGLKATKSLFNNADTEAATARFTPDIPTAGKYEVFITYPLQGNANDVKYTVTSADGTQEKAVTQYGREFKNVPPANTWFSLGVFNFAQGTGGFIEVSDPLSGAKPMAADNGRIYVDAVKLVPQGFALPADYANKGGSGAAPAAVVAATPSAEVTTTVVTTEVAALPTLPATEVAAAPAPALPNLPGTAAVPGLPSLPEASPAAPGLPSLPAATPSAPGLPSLPAATPAAPGLPSLPAATPAAPALPALPAATPAAPALPSLPETPAATPIPTPDLPSLAPVTPTPSRNLPSPSDTPIPGAPGALPPLPARGTELPTGPALPAMPAIPATVPAPAEPGLAVVATPVPTRASGELSITQYNPSGLQWMYDFGAGLNTARAQNKKVLVFFTASGNQVAQKYETEYFKHPSVLNALNNYVLVKVDFPRNTRLGYSLGIFGAGMIAVTDGTGNVTARVEQLPGTPVELIGKLTATKPARAAADSATSGTAASAVPALPAVPGAEATTDSAAVPAIPAIPAVPDTSTAVPAIPGAPAVPAVPGAPALPAVPAVPAVPDAPATPALPGAPPAEPATGGAAAALPALPGA